MGALLLLLAVGIGSSLYLMTNLNSIIAKVIEDQGSKVASVDVGVAGVDVSLKDGRGTLAEIARAEVNKQVEKEARSLLEKVIN